MNVQICDECAKTLRLLQAYDQSDLGTLADVSCYFCVRMRPTRELQIMGAIFRPNCKPLPVARSSNRMIGETFVDFRNDASDRVADALARARKYPKNRRQHLVAARVASRLFAFYRDNHHAVLRAHGISPVVNYS